MLWDPAKDRPLPMSNLSFINFLERQTGTYIYRNQCGCAIAQYLKEQFPEKDVRVTCCTYTLDGEVRGLPEGWNDAVMNVPTQSDSFSEKLFSDAAARARANLKADELCKVSVV